MPYEEYDPDLDFAPEQELPTAHAAEVDPLVLQHYVDLRRSSQHLPLAIFGGLVAAALGAGAWLGISMLTGFKIAWMAIGVGIMTGWVIRLLGRGIDRSFGVWGMLLTVIGCLAGMLLSGCWLVSVEMEDATFTSVLQGLAPAFVLALVKDMYAHEHLLYYAVALGAAYWLSIRRITRAEKAALAAASVDVSGG